MRVLKLLVGLAAATMSFGILVGLATAGRLSSSSTRIKVVWTRLEYTGGFGTVECEVTLEGSMHARTSTKVLGALTGYVTAAVVSRCARGGATMLRETLPWHVTYAAFSGVLPNITSIRHNLIGAAWRIREPTFGLTCLSRTSETSPATGTWNRESVTGAIVSVSVAGEIVCNETSSRFTGRIGGTAMEEARRERRPEDIVEAGTGLRTRITVTLI